MTRSNQVLIGCLLLGFLSGGCGALSTGGRDAREQTARYLLATAKGFRTVYTQGVVEQANRAGVTTKEEWTKDDHAIMLPAQFIKAAGFEIKEYELGLIGLSPIYKTNLPKTQAEEEALRTFIADPSLQVLTFTDGLQVKGLAPDYAMTQACADCHNAHPQSPKRNFRQGDLMGAIVVRLGEKPSGP
ncbi:MAG: DUF3365 domain-containing protein [Nitrospira sp.]|nr:DUF3365 domain-containing protein [Nitrospira sp.]